MADPGRRQQESVFCHACHHQWDRREHGMECPECHSDCVELIEEDHDPREDLIREDNHEAHPEITTPHLFRHHNPWTRRPPDPDDNIEHVEINAGPGLRFTRTSYRSSSPGLGSARPRIDDIFQNLSTIMEGTASRPRPAAFTVNPGPHGGHRQLRPDFPSSRYPAPFPDYSPWNQPGLGSTPGSPLREGSPPFGGGRHTFSTTTRLWPPRNMNDAQPQPVPVDHIQGLLGTLLQSINGLNPNGVHAPSSNSPDSPLQLFAQLLNPANAAHGDAVYTEEALDRVITQFMEQANGTSAPGPASADAISRLPKKAVDKAMMGNDGKAECSVCMDNVDIGDEVTVLPCGHWFHGECVGAWLKEHDTCPHCRQGIMPQDTQANGPRAPGEPPRNAQSSSTSPGLPGGRGVHIVNMTLPSGGPRTTREPPRPQDHRRRSSVREGRNGGEGSSSNGSSGGLSGWVRDRLGRGSGDRS